MTASTTTPSDTSSPQDRKAFHETDVTAERADTIYQKGKERVLLAEESFETYVRAHPIKSVLVASGIGLACGVLLGRKR